MQGKVLLTIDSNLNEQGQCKGAAILILIHALIL